MEQVQLKQLKHYEYFRLTNCDSPVWVRDYYDRSEQAYWCYKFDDVNHGRLFKSTKKVFVGFDF